MGDVEVHKINFTTTFQSIIMKHYCRHLRCIAFTGMLFIGLVINANAQSTEPEGFGEGGVDAPIDGGLGILIAAAVALKARKAYASRKEATKAKDD